MDFFSDDFGHDFDLIYERTFLCSMPPDRWPSYVMRVVKLLGARGRLIGQFFFGENEDPPPYPLSDELQQALFEPRLAKRDEEPVTDSLPMFIGRERWQVWHKVPRIV